MDLKRHYITDTRLPKNNPNTKLCEIQTPVQINQKQKLSVTVDALYIKQPEEGIERLKWRAV